MNQSYQPSVLAANATNHRVRWPIQYLVGVGSVLVVGIFVTLVSAHSVLSYFYFFFLSLLLYRWLVGPNVTPALFLYPMYSLLVIIMYHFQYLAYPEYIGFSGSTDDALYYFYTADWLPENFAHTFVAYGRMRQYEQIMRFLTWFPVTHPFDILFFNVLPLTLIPTFTQRIATFLFLERKIGKTAYYLVMFCPFLLANSLVLVRDGWTAMAFTGAVLFFLRKNYLNASLLTVLLFFIRLGSGIVLFIVLAFFVAMRFLRHRGSVRRLKYAFSVLVVVGLILTMVAPRLSPLLLDYLEGKDILVNGRLELLNPTFATNRGLQESAERNDNTDSLMLKVFEQNILIRLPLGFTYFFMSPFFTPNQITKGDRFVPRLVLTNIIFPVFFVFYFAYFIQAVWAAWRTGNVSQRITILAYCATVLAISQGSLQIRHKTMIMPLFYVIVAYGYHQKFKAGKILGWLGAFSLVFIQIGRLLLRIV